MKNFELMFETIPPYPGLNIAIIEDSQDLLVKQLSTFCQKVEASLHVKALKERDSSCDKDIKIKNFSFEQPKYNNFSILYDFLFLCVDISERDDIEVIFKKIYRVMKNAGNIFVFIKKEQKQRFFEILEKTNYVALNSIDLNEDIEVITAKKMHGWRKV
ncbi:MAG: hypothetical protein QM482_03855 [Sulfurospirillum sp.]